MATYTFDEGDLRKLLEQTLTEYAGEGYVEFSPKAKIDIQQTVNKIMGNLAADDWCDDATAFENDSDFIPWDGSPVIVEDDDNVSPAALGLQEAM